MQLHTPTLFLMTVVVALVVGVLFLLSWSRARTTRALAIWGAAHLVGGAAAALLSLRSLIPDSLSVGLANMLMLAAYGLMWSGIRSFEGRLPAYRHAFAGSLVWGLACLVPAFYASLPARLALASGMAGLYCALGAVEIWRGRDEPLASRSLVIVLGAAYAAFYWVRIPLAVAAPIPPDLRTLDLPWLAILCLIGTLLTIAVAFALMALTKERAEREQRIAAETDPLTGIANRRAFVERAQADCADRIRPLALLLFDLDRFKAINDTYGHAVGDGVLVGFCHLAEALLPPGALLGRLGGEEFACRVMGLGATEAARLAERLRRAVASLAVPDYPDLRIRVSIGIATKAAGGATSFDALLRRADDALYRAKHSGRDRVVVAVAVPRSVAA